MPDNSIVIELVTTDYLYSDRAAEITLRTSLDGWAERDIVGSFDNGIWQFKLSGKQYLTDFEFKFVLNRKFWSIGNNFTIPGEYVKYRRYHLNNFGFESPTYDVYRIDYVHVNEEYRALRAEIQLRSQAQQNIVYLSLISLGALVAAGVQVLDVDNTNKVPIFLNLLLLIGPWIFLSLGILWCDHDKAIHNIGIYIRDILENRCFPSITPNLNFPAIIDEDSNPYKERFRDKERSREQSRVSPIIQDLSRIEIFRILIAIFRIPIVIIQCLLRIPIAIIQELSKILTVANLVRLRIAIHFKSEDERQPIELQIKRLIDAIEPPQKLNKSKQRKYYNEKLKSVNLGWQKTCLLRVKKTKNNILILPQVFPIIYFGLPSLLLILFYIIHTINNNLFLKRVALFGDLFCWSFIFELVLFVIDLYLAYVFFMYWCESNQRRTALFRDEN